MSPELRHGAAGSAIVHAAIVAALLIGFSRATPPELPEEQAVAMVFEGAAPSAMRAQVPAPMPAPAPAPAPVPEPPSPEPPKPSPTEPPPPPPPPPPQPAPSPQPPAPTPPAPTPPPTPSPQPAPSPPPPPPAPPAPPQPQAQPQPPLPLPPPSVPPPPETPKSQTAQPNVTRNPAPNSDALQNTLEKLRAQQKQQQPPQRQANPARGGAPNAGGNPNGDDTTRLSADAVRAIGAFVRRCWTYDAGAKGVDQMQVLLTVQTDDEGVARVADIAQPDRGRLGDPIFRAFAERARRAVLSPACAELPLPRNMQGQRLTLTFRFRPGE